MSIFSKLLNRKTKYPKSHIKTDAKFLMIHDCPYAFPIGEKRFVVEHLISPNAIAEIYENKILVKPERKNAIIVTVKGEKFYTIEDYSDIKEAFSESIVELPGKDDKR